MSEPDFNSALGALMETLTSSSGSGQESATFVMGNSIWSKGVHVLPEYSQQMKAVYKATAQEARGAADINAWVADVTRGMIKELIGSDDFDAVLANALYFKGFWQTAFKKE